MSKKMLINASHPEENRVAIVVDGVLSELDIEIAGQEQTKGNIYKAVVVRVETGLQAAFVDYGAEKLGFLQIGEIHPNLYPAKAEDSKGRPRIADILKRGQEILVQIVKEERGNKGAALTTFLSLPGRYMVLMPDSTTKGVSRKISDDAERKKLKKTMAELDLPEQMGYIVRTAGIGKDKDELKRDFDYLVRLFEGITSRKDQIKAPAQLYQESNLAIRSIRDYFTTDIDELLIDDSSIYRDAKDFFSLVMPELSSVVKQHRERRPIFSRYQIEEQIDALGKNQILLPSGGSIVIDQTEALVAIDVNSGKMASESGIEATALKTNLEAANEVGRQLRLRDLGGLVVIDFIDMRDRKNIREVEVCLRKALKNDKAKVSVGRISQFGLLEMSRQRLKPVLNVASYHECPHCKGAGRVKSDEAQAVALLRQIHTAASKGQIAYVDAKVPVDVANYLLNQKRATINQLEQQLELQISISGTTQLLPGEIEVEARKKEKETETQNQIAPISHANQIEVALAAQQEDLAHNSGEALAAEADEINDSDSDSGNDSDSGEEENKSQEPKKRRRRRRRKPQADKNAVTPEAPVEDERPVVAAPETTAEQIMESAPAAQENDNAAAAHAATAEAEAHQVDQDQSGTAETAVNTTLPVETAERIVPAAEPSTKTAAEDTEKKPRRRTRRSPRKKPAEKTAAVAEDPGQQAEQSAEPQIATESGMSGAQTEELEPAAAGEENKPKAPRRRTRKPKAAPKKEGAAESQAAPVAAADAQTAAVPAVIKTESPVTAEFAPLQTAQQTPAQVSAGETAVQETPQPASTPSQPGTPAAVAKTAAGEVAETAAAEEKPKRKPRRTSPRKKSDETPKTNAAAATQASQEESAQADAKPKPARRRTTRKAKPKEEPAATTQPEEN